ncbi:glycoside hydrolase, end-alpha-1,4-polygalactosaminidase [Colwellia sp. 75C3]|uniref:endo alpha-1,4 polygalactosaminidase n=1 Tax=Colwellia sp. 75C3 TaxID=888425 RepID=UPI000C34103A|nr:endo alpha-1,4 polygalactosaminidase [Colwellia sp. 75C3]PKG82880.1 glycoside hydrolase, end-alpha-1,4-polygalactosaminidase [Colwellia sp. 75C3]
MYHKIIALFGSVVFLVLGITACGSDSSDDPGVTVDPVEIVAPDDIVEPISVLINDVSIDTWMYQIQGLDDNTKIDTLAVTDYDMIVVEPGHNFIGFSYDTDYLVNQLESKSNGDERILLAYVDIGEAEDYRTYWQSDWVAPTENAPGSPSFLVTIDPDGWTGNYPVAYWQNEWKDIWLGPDGIVAELANAGFHGIYLDWVEAYDDDTVRAYAQEEGVNPEEEMMLFIEEIGAAGRAIRSDFIVIAQNAPYLLDHDPVRYAAMIDAIALEDTWFYGEGDAEWGDSNAGDLSGGERHNDEYSTASRITQNHVYLDFGVPVFTVDYCISESNANMTYGNSRREGFVPLVTRVSLSELTETPPPN